MPIFGVLNMKKDFYESSYYKKADPGAFDEGKQKKYALEKEFYGNLLQLKPGEKVLDVACGSGNMLYLLKDTGADLFGIDISKTAVEIAKKRVEKPEQIVCADADPLPYKDNEFDCILALGVIEHFPDISSIVRQIARCVKKTGRVIIAVPNTYYYKFVWDTLRKGSGPCKHQEIETLYSFKEWKEIIERSGLTVERTARHNKFNRTRLESWLCDLFIPFYFSNHFVFVCVKQESNDRSTVAIHG